MKNINVSIIFIVLTKNMVFYNFIDDIKQKKLAKFLKLYLGKFKSFIYNQLQTGLLTVEMFGDTVVVNNMLESKKKLVKQAEALITRR